MEELIKERLGESARLKEEMLENQPDEIARIAQVLIDCIKRGGKVVFCGNGGSAADCQHLAAEFVGRFKLERPALAAIALTTDTSILTALGNDYGFDTIFARQVEGIVRGGDVLFGISTSGNSPNVLKAIEKARSMGAVSVAFTGSKGGSIAEVADHTLKVPSDDTPRIQEAHITVGHILCELVENELFKHE